MHFSPIYVFVYLVYLLYVTRQQGERRTGSRPIEACGRALRVGRQAWWRYTLTDVLRNDHTISNRKPQSFPPPRVILLAIRSTKPALPSRFIGLGGEELHVESKGAFCSDADAQIACAQQAQLTAPSVGSRTETELQTENHCGGIPVVLQSPGPLRSILSFILSHRASSIRQIVRVSDRSV